MPIALRGPRKAMRGSVNAGTKVQTRTGRVRKAVRAMGARRGRLSAPWLRFHGVDRADVYIIIRVCASYCGECALNPPTSPPIPRQSPSLAPAQRHALAEHFRSPTQRRCTPAGCAMHSSPTAFARPRTATRPRRALPPPTQRRRTPAGCAMHSPQPSQLTPRRRPSLAPAQRHALPEHFRSPTQPRRTPTQPRRTPLGCAMHSPQPSQPIPRQRPSLAPAQRRALPLPSCHIPAAQTHARRLRHAFLADPTTHSPPKTFARPRSATLPPLPFRFGHKKTAPHSACAMPNVSVDRRCGRSLGLVSRALFAAVAGRWRVGVGLRPQP